MMTPREIRRESLKTLRSGWLWRILTVGILLNAITQTATQLLHAAFRAHGMTTWTDFLQSKAELLQQGLTAASPSRAVSLQMTGASCFELFITCLFSAILAFGCAGITLRAVRNHEGPWFAASLGGFSRPFGLFGLIVLVNLRVLLWSCLFLIPGLVAAYRYRQVWYIKNEHPEWTASECLAESARIMAGYKWKAFSLDCSYAGAFLIVVLAFAIGVICSKAEGALALAGAAVNLFAGAYLLFVLCHFFTGRAVFYRELRRERPAEKTERNPSE